MKPWEYKPRRAEHLQASPGGADPDKRDISAFRAGATIQPEEEISTCVEILIEDSQAENIQAHIPKTLEDFLALDYYPAVTNGLLTLRTLEGEPASSPAILTAWQAAKAQVKAELEACYVNVLLPWSEGIISKHGYVFLATDVLACKTEMSISVDRPQYLAAELLRCKACGIYAQVRTVDGKMHALGSFYTSDTMPDKNPSVTTREAVA